ncbi:alanine aminotransferase 2-like [Lates japonicus]
MSSLQQVSPTVRGIRVSPHTALQSLAAHITQEITQGAQKPFKELIDINSCSPHQAGMKPVSFVRQVLAVCLYPQLLEDKSLPVDVRLRAQSLLEVCPGGSVGSYTASSGMPHIRQSIAGFITRRDGGVSSYAKDIFISAGSQRGLMLLVKLLARGEGVTRTGVLTPLPCPHTLPMLLDEAGVTSVPYQLTEERGWAVDLDELHRALKTARGHCEPRAIYISNPGNPTGHVQDRKSIEEVIQFAAAERLLLLVDEVFQDSVYRQDREFISYKKVLFEMDEEYSETVELVSFHSLSSPCMGECGLRAGFMEAINMDPEVMQYLDILLDTDISTPVTGQLALDLMVNPPKPGDPSYDTYTQEILLARATMSQNVQRAWQFLDGLPGMSCQPAMGGVYLYPSLHLPPEITEQAKSLEVEADVLYCQRLLQEEGVFLAAGCQHGGATDRHYLRLCVLVPPDTLEEVLARLGSFHLRLMDRFPPANRGVKDRDRRQNTEIQHREKHK